MKRYLLVSDECGVYLGSALGFGFWSKLDGAGQDAACTFPSETSVAEHVAGWGEPPNFDVRTIEVEVADRGTPEPAIYATLAECVAAGCEEWSP